MLIPCFNAERWIAQAIESALAQTWPEKEVIVVDDGSTDRSLEVIREYDGRIRWISGPNQGSNATRNRLLKLAQGQWLQYLDADDYLRPEKVARQVEFAQRNPEYDVIYSPTAWERVENGALICTDEVIPELRDPWILLALWRLPQTSGTLWKKATLERVGGWRVGLPCCQEHELYCRLLEANARFVHCEGCLAVYCDREDDNRITRKSRGEWERQRLAILDRIEKCLEERSKLTAPRRQAVNDARHELARRFWRIDRQLAMNTLQRILISDRCFVPTLGSSSPLLYSMVYRTLGFRTAQTVASFKRTLTRW
jgi:glycosyltransferase involved in cell wall biosynthesis